MLEIASPVAFEVRKSPPPEWLSPRHDLSSARRVSALYSVQGFAGPCAAPPQGIQPFIRSQFEISRPLSGQRRSHGAAKANAVKAGLGS